MKIYCCKELKVKTVNELLDLLSSYLKLEKGVCKIIKKDPELEPFYISNYLYFYELNIRKIKNELLLKSEVKT